jgi:uncharacterized protein (DUF486 family)
VTDMGDIKKTKETGRLAFMVGLAIVIAVSFIFWGVNTLRENYLVGISLVFGAVGAIAISVWVFVSERRKISSGLPMQDERSKMIFQKATSYSFYTTMYFVLFLMIFIDEPFLNDHLTAVRALEAAIAEMIIALFVFLAYFHFRGAPE